MILGTCLYLSHRSERSAAVLLRNLFKTSSIFFFLASNKSLLHYKILCNVLQGFEGVLLA